MSGYTQEYIAELLADSIRLKEVEAENATLKARLASSEHIAKSIAHASATTSDALHKAVVDRDDFKLYVDVLKKEINNLSAQGLLERDYTDKCNKNKEELSALKLDSERLKIILDNLSVFNGIGGIGLKLSDNITGLVYASSFSGIKESVICAIDAMRGEK